MNNPYAYELAKINQAELEKRASRSRLINQALRTAGRRSRASAPAPAVGRPSPRIAVDQAGAEANTERAELSSAGSTRS